MPRALIGLAWTNAVLHGVGLALAVVAMRPGTAAFPAAERTAYLATRPLGWSLGWATWMLCALALVGFLAVLAHQRHSALAALAVALAAAGAAVDLTGDTLQIVVLPGLAADGPTPLFMVAERAIAAAGLVAANGLYSVAVLLLTLDRADLGPLVRWLGWGTFAAGMLMVAAGFTGDPRHVELSTGLTIGLFVPWCFAAAYRRSA